jgi:hypothetical protein
MTAFRIGVLVMFLAGFAAFVELDRRHPPLCDPGVQFVLPYDEPRPVRQQPRRPGVPCPPPRLPTIDVP